MKHGSRYLLLFLFVITLCRAQSVSALAGTVSDPAGAAIPSATVAARESETGFSRTTVAGSTGAWVISSLRPTTYMVSVEAPGFRKFVQTGVLLPADQTVTLNVTLELGATAETVTVSAAAPQVDTYTPTVGGVVDEKRIVDLPLNGRNAATLTTLIPGTVVDTGAGNDADQGSTKTFPTAVTVSINGSRQNQVAFLLDGTNNLDIWTNVNLPFPFPDSLQEFSAQTANFSAAYGQNAGGVINVITQSGTNSVHGSLFDFFRNADLNARNFFEPSRDALKRNQFGGTIGGPVVVPRVYNGQERTFFFFGYQGTQIRDTLGNGQAFVPTAAELNGDFSDLLGSTSPVQLIDPATKQPFADNRIPVSRFDPAALKLANSYLPHATGGGSIVFPTPESQSYNEFVTRVDQAVGTNGQLSFRYFGDRFENTAEYANNDLFTDTAGSTLFSQNFLLREVQSIRPNLLNDARFSFVRLHSLRGPAGDIPSFGDLGVNIYQPPGPVGIHGLSVDGYFDIGNYPRATFVRNLFSWSDDVTWTHGRHSLSFGGVIERARIDINNPDISGGDFSFSGDGTGNAMADFLLGSVRKFSQDNGYVQNDRNSFYGIYLQDVFKVHSRLTLTAGLRWEPWLAWKEINGRAMHFDPNAYSQDVRSSVYTNAPPGLLFPGDADFPPNGVRNSMNHFAPRIGFAYDLTGNGKTSLRGGAGVFYDTRTNGNTNIGAASETPYTLHVTLTSPSGPFSNPYLGITNPFPTPFPPTKDVQFPSPVETTSYDPSGQYHVPAIYTWNLTLERQVAPNWLLRTSYVGTHANHITETLDLNPSVYIPGSSLSPDQRRLFRGYADIFIDSETVNSNYNALQATLERRFQHQFTLLATYTYSKSLDDLPYGGGVTGVPNGSSWSPVPWYEPGFHQMDYGPSEFDHAHNLSVSYVWMLPSLAHGNRLLRGGLGSWQLSGIVSAMTGDPLTVLAGIDASQTSLGADRGVALGGPSRLSGACADISPCTNWLNQNAFGLPADGSFGNAGKGSLRGPGLFNWDVGLMKNIPIRETVRLQFRAEYFNVFNHTNFNDPDTTISGGGFGQIFSARDPRIGQFALKILF